MSRAPRARKPVAKYAVAREPRALFDVNVLIALLDTDHLHHARATQWLAGHIEAGWASCAITQNGCVCITSQPGYPNPLPAARVAERLRAATATPHHLYIGDAPSLLDEKAFDSEQLLGHRQVADARRGCAPPAPARDFRCSDAVARRAPRNGGPHRDPLDVGQSVLKNVRLGAKKYSPPRIVTKPWKSKLCFALAGSSQSLLHCGPGPATTPWPMMGSMPVFGA